MDVDLGTSYWRAKTRLNGHFFKFFATRRWYDSIDFPYRRPLVVVVVAL